MNEDLTSNEILYGIDYLFVGVKELLETEWLDKTFPGKWEQVYTDDDGWDIELADNQWLVVFRVGKDEYSFDFHFWYRTNRGVWANKHGYRGTGSELLDDMPSNDESPGWALGDKSEFYNSDIIYYIVTEG